MVLRVVSWFFTFLWLVNMVFQGSFVVFNGKFMGFHGSFMVFHGSFVGFRGSLLVFMVFKVSSWFVMLIGSFSS